MVTLIRVDDQRRTAAVDLERRAVQPLPIASADSIDLDVASVACGDDDPAREVPQPEGASRGQLFRPRDVLGVGRRGDE
jgi:hypothetical protein